MDLRHAKRDEVIFRQGEPSRCMYRIQSGRVGIFLNYGENRETKLAELTAGRYFGEMGLLDSAPRSATARGTFPSALKKTPPGCSRCCGR